MFGLEIEKDPGFPWISTSVFLAVSAVALGIWWGPGGIFTASGAGLALSVVGWRSSNRGVLAAMGLVHGFLLFLALLLWALFLHKLPDPVLQMPRLTHVYRDPQGLFDLRGPAGWVYTAVATPEEAGVRLRPASQNTYMGISEVAVFVRKLKEPPKSTDKFLGKMASSLAGNRIIKKKLFRFSTEPARLLNEDAGVWSVLNVKKFWVPLTQISLFGIKDKIYFCSVSATGIKAHDTLSKVMCLGLMEAIEIHGAKRK
jgi:hypothetical protein